jgi:hypothetical protein
VIPASGLGLRRSAQVKLWYSETSRNEVRMRRQAINAVLNFAPNVDHHVTVTFSHTKSHIFHFSGNARNRATSLKVGRYIKVAIEKRCHTFLGEICDSLDCCSVLKVYAVLPYKRASQVYRRNASKFTADTLTRFRKAL